MKKICILILSGLFLNLIASAQLYDQGRYLYDAQSGIHWDKAARTIGSMPTSNPSPNPVRAYNNAVNQANAYNTPDQYYVRGMYVPPQPVYYSQPQLPRRVPIQATCYFLDANQRVICMNGTCDDGMFYPTDGAAWDGHTWTSVQIGVNPFTDLSFCGGYQTDARGSRNWYRANDWNTSQYPYLNDGWNPANAPSVFH